MAKGSTKVLYCDSASHKLTVTVCDSKFTITIVSLADTKTIGRRELYTTSFTIEFVMGVVYGMTVLLEQKDIPAVEIAKEIKAALLHKLNNF